MEHRVYEVTDDSGLLAFVDPLSYRSFVGNDWALDQLVRHLKSETELGRLVIWGTGREDTWRVEIRLGNPPEPGFREFTAVIRASGEHLLLTNYESLTMAAQFESVTLPEPHARDLLVPVQPGLYRCRVVQRFDPEPHAPSLRDDRADFVVELAALKEADRVNIKATPGIPWSDM